MKWRPLGDSNPCYRRERAVSLSFLPRLMVILLTLIVLGPWLLRQLMEYTQTLIGNIPLLIG